VRVPVRLCVCVVKRVTNCEASLLEFFVSFTSCVFDYDMSPSVLFSATPACQLDIKKNVILLATHFCASALLLAVRASPPCPQHTGMLYEVIRQFMHDAVTVEDCFFKSARTN